MIKTRVMILMTLLVIGGFGSLPIDAESQWDQEGVAPDKRWTVEFNTALSENSITEESVYVENGSDEKVGTVSAQLSNGQKKILVENEELYEKGESYQLVVTDHVMSDSGKYLSSPVIMDFKIKEEEQQTLADNSRSNPAGIGETVFVENKDWLDGYQNYEIELTEIVSGSEALAMVKEANPYNETPEEGEHYVLAKFRVHLLELEQEPYYINNAQFNAVSENGVTYDKFVSVAGLDPALSRELYEGAEHEGWTYFMTDENDDPSAVFNQSFNDEVWFDLSE